MALLFGTTGCGLRLQGGPTPSPTLAAPGADELARARAEAQAQRLLALVSAVRRQRPDLSSELALVAADHRAHAAALRAPEAGRAAPTSAAARTPEAAGTTAAAGTPGSTHTKGAPPSVPAVSARTALVTLLGAERVGQASALGDLQVVGPSTARLLASVAAALQVHVDLLSGLQSRRRP